MITSNSSEVGTPHGEYNVTYIMSSHSQCGYCFDTGVTVSCCDDIGDCGFCHAANLSQGGRMIFESVAYRTAKDLPLGGDQIRLARALAHFTGDGPISLKALQNWLGRPGDDGAREIKRLIAELRREWLLPVGSRKGQPNGYWMIRTAGEFLDWHRRYRAQALTEITTGYAVMRANFPDLAGQGKFTFVAEFTNDLEEALRGQL